MQWCPGSVPGSLVTVRLQAHRERFIQVVYRSLARAQRSSMDAARRSALARRPPRRRRVAVLLTLTLLTGACTTAGGHDGTSAATGHTPLRTPDAPLSTSAGAPSSAPAVSI